MKSKGILQRAFSDRIFSPILIANGSYEKIPKNFNPPKILYNLLESKEP